MAKRNDCKNSDVEECRAKIEVILQEYNCSIYSCDDWTSIYMVDNDDIEQTTGITNPRW